MSIEKWLDDEATIEERKKREEIYKSLSKEEKNDLKQQKARDLAQRAKEKGIISDERKDLLNKVIEFKDWLDIRTYIKGDIERIETWIETLYILLRESLENQDNHDNEDGKKGMIDDYKSIPVDFLDEKTRIALNKKLRGMKKTNSDNYYLRKLKTIVREKINDVKYYYILRDILES
ncbi:MAG: hypothetical protein KGD70_03535 [Candidatus Lokiarchaeota archaeon]|nr:hypothetical protein [Candidatus Lokiarchaeota archaeon]